jgi:hypothetical protein
MSAIDRQIANQIANIERTSGRGLSEWLDLIRASGLERHGEIIAMLKRDHGLGHGNANLLATKARESFTGGRPSEDAMIDAHYSGRAAALRPLYDEVVRRIGELGSDIELAPKKSYVSLRRRKQFGQVGPAGTRLEICLNLPGTPPGGRLEAARGMATHRVRLSSADEMDEEMMAWLREAYERAG